MAMRRVQNVAPVLIHSLWLVKKDKRSIAPRLVPRPRAKRVDFEIVENAKAKEDGMMTWATYFHRVMHWRSARSVAWWARLENFLHTSIKRDWLRRCRRAWD
ncbi:MAG TPA: hypothetical protein VMF69_26345 [Gemmataceae bacterium]|nr:hypothetical protein [Gemmataceae bacterium]